MKHAKQHRSVSLVQRLLGRHIPTRRDRVIIAFDEHYSAKSTAVYSIARHLTDQLGSGFDYRLFSHGRFAGPKFDGPAQVKLYETPPRVWPRVARFKSGVRRILERAHITESPGRWTSNLKDGEDRLTRLLFDAERLHAMVMLAGDPGTALRLSRIAHIYSGSTVPHLILVTPNHWIEPRLHADLEWLGVRIVYDGDRVIDPPSPRISRKYLALPVTPAIRPTFSFLAWDEYPRHSRGPLTQIDWSTLLGPERTHPSRVKDVVLFVRPDWMNCGSGTTFESLARWFRGRDALLIDVAIWPYARPFTPETRHSQVAAEQEHIGAALYFSARLSTSLPHVIRQIPKLGRWFPRTWARQKLLQHALAAKPRFMRTAIRRANVSQIYVNHYFTYGYAVDLIGDRPFFLDTHDIQAVNFIHHEEHNILTRRVDRFGPSLHDEMEIAGRAARLCFVAPEELEIAARFIDESRLDYILPLPGVVPCVPRPPNKPERLLIVASLNIPNTRGMTWFLSNVWPRVLQMCGPYLPPAVCICGSIDEALGNVRMPGIQFVGVVADLRIYYDQCDLVLLPVITGGGVAIKTLEAVLHERAVLATRHALRGLPENVVDAIGFEDDPAEYAKLILTIVKDPKRHRLQLERSRRAAALLRQYPFYETLGKAVDSVRLSTALPKHS